MPKKVSRPREPTAANGKKKDASTQTNYCEFSKNKKTKSTNTIFTVSNCEPLVVLENLSASRIKSRGCQYVKQKRIVLNNTKRLPKIAENSIEPNLDKINNSEHLIKKVKTRSVKNTAEIDNVNSPTNKNKDNNADFVNNIKKTCIQNNVEVNNGNNSIEKNKDNIFELSDSSVKKNLNVTQNLFDNSNISIVSDSNPNSENALDLCRIETQNLKEKSNSKNSSISNISSMLDSDNNKENNCCNSVLPVFTNSSENGKYSCKIIGNVTVEPRKENNNLPSYTTFVQFAKRKNANSTNTSMTNEESIDETPTRRLKSHKNSLYVHAKNYTRNKSLPVMMGNSDDNDHSFRSNPANPLSLQSDKEDYLNDFAQLHTSTPILPENVVEASDFLCENEQIEIALNPISLSPGLALNAPQKKKTTQLVDKDKEQNNEEINKFKSPQMAFDLSFIEEFHDSDENNSLDTNETVKLNKTNHDATGNITDVEDSFLQNDQNKNRKELNHLEENYQHKKRAKLLRQHQHKMPNKKYPVAQRKDKGSKMVRKSSSSCSSSSGKEDLFLQSDNDQNKNDELIFNNADKYRERKRAKMLRKQNIIVSRKFPVHQKKDKCCRIVRKRSSSGSSSMELERHNFKSLFISKKPGEDDSDDNNVKGTKIFAHNVQVHNYYYR